MTDDAVVLTHAVGQILDCVNPACSLCADCIAALQRGLRRSRDQPETWPRMMEHGKPRKVLAEDDPIRTFRGPQKKARP